MKPFLIWALLFIISDKLSSQNHSGVIDTAYAKRFAESWTQDLTTPGVRLDRDSLQVNEEIRRLLMDSMYRKEIYPSAYTWPVATNWMSKMDLKKAFWCFINLYATDTLSKNLVIQSIITYDQVIDMEKALVASFYTYSFADPEVGSVVNNKFLVNNPELMERKFNQMKEMVSLVLNYRVTKNQQNESNQKMASPQIK